jgi:hypothetical protein
VALGRLRHRNDAPLIGERAATRGPSATEGGDERASVQRRIPSSSSFGGSRDAALPAGLDERFASAHGRLGRRNDVPLIGKRAATRGRTATEGSDGQASSRRRIHFKSSSVAEAEPHFPKGLDEHFPSAHGRLGRPNDAPLIGERDARARRDGRWR